MSKPPSIHRQSLVQSPACFIVEHLGRRHMLHTMVCSSCGVQSVTFNRCKSESCPFVNHVG